MLEFFQFVLVTFSHEVLLFAVVKNGNDATAICAVSGAASRVAFFPSLHTQARTHIRMHSHIKAHYKYARAHSHTQARMRIQQRNGERTVSILESMSGIDRCQWSGSVQGFMQAQVECISIAKGQS